VLNPAIGGTVALTAIVSVMLLWDWEKMGFWILLGITILKFIVLLYIYFWSILSAFFPLYLVVYDILSVFILFLTLFMLLQKKLEDGNTMWKHLE
jgi:hypothetical protein